MESWQARWTPPGADRETFVQNRHGISGSSEGAGYRRDSDGGDFCEVDVHEEGGGEQCSETGVV